MDHSDPTTLYDSAERTISPAEIGEFLSFDHCSRYFKHQSQNVTRTANHPASDFTEAFHPLNLLLAKAGEDFERDTLEQLEDHVEAIHDLTTDDEQLSPDHTVVTRHVVNALTAPASRAPIVLYQPTLTGAIEAWGVGGHADFVFIWSTDTGVTIRTVDAKSAKEQKAYHQIQAAIYTDLIRQHLSSVADVDLDRVELSAGVVTRDETYLPPTREGVPSFDYASRIVDTRRLLDDSGELIEVAETDFEDVQYQLDDKCAGCPYNESCVTESFEEGSVRLLGLTESEQSILASHGIETLEELADICRPPDEWNPTNYQKASWPRPEYRTLKSLPGIGERLPDLVYEAQALVDRFTDSDRVDTFPATWIPGTGRCRLPDDTPPESFSIEFKRGSMIRVYLNIQEDYLRDRVIQLNARVTATASTAPPQRISCLAERAPTDETESTHVEESLLEEFAEELYAAIREVDGGIDFSDHHQQNPLLHIYTYTEGETDALMDAFDRHDTPLTNSLHDLLEGSPGMDSPRISHLREEIHDHVSLESPSIGLIHAYDELQPASDDYNKPRDVDSWSYEPPYTASNETVDMRSIFRRRLFNISVEWEADNGRAIVDPSVEDDVHGLNTRVRFGAAIPLGYIWSAVGEIDDEWVDESGFDTDQGLAGYELGNYRYHDESTRNQEIRPADVEALGRNLCDVLEHVERGLYFRDVDITSNKEPLDIGTLEVDSFDSISVGEAALSYLWMEYTASQDEKYETYRKMPPQRILSGDSLPVQITDVDTDAGNNLSATVTGRLRYDQLFSEGEETVKRNCRRKGGQGTSSGDWMVANPLDPGKTRQEMSDPQDLERGVSATIKALNLQANEVVFELSNQWWDPGEFGSRHRNWTTKSTQAKNDDGWTYVSPGEWLILDPQTDSISAEREKKALDTIQANALHDLVEGVRWGNTDAISDTVFDAEHLQEFADWVSDTIEPESLPNANQEEFVIEDSQILLLQGPPGTGKTAGAVAPSLCARIHAAEKADKPLSGLVTAPSNTAIDELMDDVAALVEKLQSDPDGPAGFENINLVRLSGDRPDHASDVVEYADYNGDDGEKRLDELKSVLLGGSSVATDGGTTAGGDSQATFDSFTESDSSESGASEDLEHTLFFATPTKSWGLLKHFAGSSDADSIANQRYWDLMAIDEASMMTMPKLLLAGTAMESEAQLLVSGDHRQLPPVQKHDWGEETRRDIRDAIPYLSALDYLRLLAGDADVIDGETAEIFSHDIDSDAIEIPMVRLDETYRFGPQTAEFVRRSVYEADGIDYDSGRKAADIETRHTATTAPLESVYDTDAPIVLITYDSEQTYQQVNPVEAAISQTLLLDHHSDLTAGLVTPHNAQRSRLQEMLHELQHSDDHPDVDIEVGENTLVETVERFQGGEQDLMIVSATVSDPRYIDAENEFLLQQNRANVSFTRHQNKLIVVAPETLFGHIPSDPEVYDEAELWKAVAVAAGEAPSEYQTAPDWSGSLEEFVTDKSSLPTHLDGNTALNVYRLESLPTEDHSYIT